MAQVRGTEDSGAALPHLEFEMVSIDVSTRRVIGWVGIGVGLFFWLVAHKKGSTLFRVLGALALLAGSRALWKTKVVVDGAQKTISLRSVFLDRYVIFERKFSFGDFTAIIVRCDVGAEDRTANVCLRKNSRRRMVLRYGRSESDAFWVARRLAEMLHLPIEREEYK